MKWLLAALVLAGSTSSPAAYAAGPGGCYATVCKVIACSTSMSGENGLHTPDDALAPPQNLPVGCDDSIAKVP